jgi:CDP-6-deoxy-D-xylo-4-hexulose-3-dehydrase
VEARKRNFRKLHDGLSDLEDALVLPRATEGSDPSWFGFPIAVRPESGVTRNELVEFLESRHIATRQLFGANLSRQPAYAGLPHRRVGDLANSDYVMENVFWVGVYPGLTDAQSDYMVESLRAGVGRA